MSTYKLIDLFVDDQNLAILQINLQQTNSYLKQVSDQCLIVSNGHVTTIYGISSYFSFVSCWLSITQFDASFVCRIQSGSK